MNNSSNDCISERLHSSESQLMTMFSEASSLTFEANERHNERHSMRASIDTFVTRRMQMAALERWELSKDSSSHMQDSHTSRTSESTTDASWEENMASFNQSTYAGSGSFFYDPTANSKVQEENDKSELDLRLKKELQSKQRGRILLKIRKKKQGGRWMRLQPRKEDAMKVVKTNGTVLDKKPYLQDMVDAFRNYLPTVFAPSEGGAANHSNGSLDSSNRHKAATASSKKSSSVKTDTDSATVQSSSTAPATHASPKQAYALMAQAMKKHIAVKDRSYHLTTYQDCFLGSDAVHFIQKYLKLETRQQALEVGREMNDRIHCFEHVCGNHVLKDQYLFFRFTESFKRQPQQQPQPQQTQPLPRKNKIEMSTAA